MIRAQRWVPHAPPAPVAPEKAQPIPGTLLWVDAIAPDEAEWRWLSGHFALHPLAVEEAQRRGLRARLFRFEDALVVTVRAWRSGAFSVPDPTADVEDATCEIDLFLREGLALTVRDPASDAADWCAAMRQPGVGFFLHAVLDAVIDNFYPVMDDLDAQIDVIETAVFAQGNHADITPALRLKKRLLLLRQTVAPLRDLLNQLLRLDTPLLEPAVEPYLQDVYDRALRLTEQVDLHRDILTGVMEATMAQISNRLNQQMKRLTALAAIVLPITAITSFFGMNIGHFEKAPSWAIYAASGGMALASLGAWMVFKRRGYW